MEHTNTPHAVGIGSFNRVPSGPREHRSTGWIPTRGALPTRLNECAILNRHEYLSSRGNRMQWSDPVCLVHRCVDRTQVQLPEWAEACDLVILV